MFAFLSNFLQLEQIDCFAALPLADCRVTRPYLLERAGILDGTAIVLAVPYYTAACDDPRRNLSAYAVSKDYHLFFGSLFDRLLPLLRQRFPANRFIGFADHSPIDELHAAARAGLGVIGKNRLLITEKYSSYVFLGEILTDAILPSTPTEPRFCSGCGACTAACPMQKGEECLSALTQKKGALSPRERERLAAHPLAWGCDLCQEACPHTVRAKKAGTIYSPVPFFSEDPIAHLERERLAAMDDAAFAERAYAWRKRETIRRNLEIREKGEPLC